MRIQFVLRIGPLLAALSLAGCVSDGASTGARNAFASTGSTTVAFESVDGPPPQIFERLVGALDSEAKLRGLPIVSREGNATYRVRSYLSAQVRGKRTTIAWAWDVYDRNEQRALRLSGEETTGRAGSDAWAAADDLVIRRIAQSGLTGLNGLLVGQVPPKSPATPRESGPAVAETTSPASVPVALSFRQD